MQKLSMKKTKGFRPIWLAVLLMVAVLVLLGVVSARIKSRAAAEAAESARVEEHGIEVVTALVEPVTIPDYVTLPGTLRPWADVFVAAEKAGRIVEMPVEPGYKVEEGDLLLRVDSDIWETVARRAEIEAVEAEKEFRRIQGLSRSGAVSESDLDAARKWSEIASVVLAEAKAHLSKCEARSPITGVVEEKLFTLGEHPGEGQAVVRIADTRRLRLAIDLPERDALALKPGDIIEFFLSAMPGIGREGTTLFVSSVAQEGSNAFRTEIEVDNADGEMKAGMIVSARILRGYRKDSVAVPLSAVVPDRGEHVVYVVENGYAVRRTVRIDAILDRVAALESGLERGERFVIEGQRGLYDGRRVFEAASKEAGHDG